MSKEDVDYTYSTLRTRVTAWLLSHTTGAAPMDISNFDKGDGADEWITTWDENTWENYEHSVDRDDLWDHHNLGRYGPLIGWGPRKAKYE